MCILARPITRDSHTNSNLIFEEERPTKNDLQTTRSTQLQVDNKDIIEIE